MKPLLLPLIGFSLSIALANATDLKTYHTLNKVTLGITITTNKKVPAERLTYVLVKAKFSNKELLEELFARDLISIIKGYEIVELCDDSTELGFYAYNRKTGNAVAIPADLLHYEKGVEDADLVYGLEKQIRSTNKKVITTEKSSAKSYSRITVAGADGQVFSWVNAVRISNLYHSDPFTTESTYDLDYQSKVAGYSDKNTDDTSADDYVIDGTIRSNHGKVVDPEDFLQQS